MEVKRTSDMHVAVVDPTADVDRFRKKQKRKRRGSSDKNVNVAVDYCQKKREIRESSDKNVNVAVDYPQKRRKNKNKKKQRRKSLETSFPDSYKFFPSPPTTLKSMYEDDEEEEFEGILGPKAECIGLDPYFDQEPEYPEGIQDIPDLRDVKVVKSKAVKSKNVSGDEEVKCKRVDIAKVLSNKGKRDYLIKKNDDDVLVKTLKGKYVVVCCFFVPILNDSFEVEVIRALNAAHSQLSASGQTNFEIVMVAKMRSTWDRKVVFDHFFSGFHHDTLAIPFWDSESRDRLCKSLNLESESVATLIVDSQGLVLQLCDARNFRVYGSNFFPFTDKHLVDLKKEDEILKLRLDSIYKETKMNYLKKIVGDVDKVSSSRLSLGDLLGCDSLSRIINEDAFCEKDCISVSELSQKVVGVYLCRDGSFMDTFYEAQQRCLSRGRDFVIVLVCLAFQEDHCSFLNHIKLALKKRYIESWWLFPFSDKACRRLWRLTGCSLEDSIIIVPPGEKSAELEGKSVLTNFGYIDHYPFTRETIIENKLSMLKSHTIESLLKEFKFLVQGKGGAELPVSDLRGKKVILYLDEFNYYDDDLCLYNLLTLRYYDIKFQHQGSEVVFLPMHTHVRPDQGIPKMPWLMLPHASTSVTKQLFSDIGQTRHKRTLVAFGGDGKICSRNAQVHLKKNSIDVSSLFNDSLRQELLNEYGDLEASYA